VTILRGLFSNAESSSSKPTEKGWFCATGIAEFDKLTNTIKAFLVRGSKDSLFSKQELEKSTLEEYPGVV
jgi:hypothetical protein